MDKYAKLILDTSFGNDNKILSGLNYILNNIGAATFNDSGLVDSILMDFAPDSDYKKDRTRIKTMIDCGALKKLVIDIGNFTDNDICFIKAVNKLVDDNDMRPEAAVRTVLYFMELFGLIEDLTCRAKAICLLEESDEEKIEQHMNHTDYSLLDEALANAQNSIVQKRESYHNEPEPTFSSVQSANQPIYNDDIVINKINVFSGDGEGDGNKNYSDWFFEGELRYVGIKIVFTLNKPFNNVNVSWMIVLPDGSQTDELKGTYDLLNNVKEQYISLQYGWNELGNWAVGKYRIQACVGQSKPFSACFEVRPGRFDVFPFRIDRIDLFETEELKRNYDCRHFSNKFLQRNTRQVYYQLAFNAPRRNLIVPIRYILKNQKGDIITDETNIAQINYDYNRFWSGYGWTEYGHWEKGKYTYTISMSNSKEYTVKFKIV